MALQIKHTKTVNIPDWTQAELDTGIATGVYPNFPAGTVLNDIFLPSDANANHTLTGTKADFNAACSDGDFLYVGDIAPAGATTQVQFNDGGAFAGDADFAYDKTSNTLTLRGNYVSTAASTATSGTPTVNSNKVALNASQWNGTVAKTVTRVDSVKTRNATYGVMPKFIVGHSVDGSTERETFTVEAGDHYSDGFAAAVTFRSGYTDGSDFATGWGSNFGGRMEAQHDGNFAFKPIDADAYTFSGMRARSFGTHPAYASFYAQWGYAGGSNYSADIRSYFDGNVNIGAGLPSWIDAGNTGKTGNEKLNVTIPTEISIPSATKVGLTINGAASQSGNYIDAKNSSAASMFKVEADGTVTLRNNITGSNGSIVLRTGTNPTLELRGDNSNGYSAGISFYWPGGAQTANINAYGGISLVPNAGYTTSAFSYYQGTTAFTAKGGFNGIHTVPLFQLSGYQGFRALGIWQDGSIKSEGSLGSYTRPLARRTGLTATASGSGSALAAGTYYYKVTASNWVNETIGSVEASVTITAGQNVVLSWDYANVEAVDHYRVYRATSAGGYTATSRIDGGTIGVPFYSVTFTDTGQTATTGTPPTSITGDTQTYRAWEGQTGAILKFENSAGTGTSKINAEGEFESTDSAKGIILKSPNGTRWRIKVDNAGTLSTTSL